MSVSAAPSDNVIAQFVEVAVEATRAMMRIVRPLQTGPRRALLGSLKAGDNTVVTFTDYACAKAGLEVLRAGLAEIPVHDEEQGLIGPAHPRYVIWKDPVDGTKAHTFGAGTETHIIALYDTLLEQVVACVVGHPASGQIRVAQLGQPTYVLYTEGRTEPEREDCHVWQGAFEQGTFVQDLYGPFKAYAGTKQVWTREAMAEFVRDLILSGVDLGGFGSNGLHQALMLDPNPVTQPKGVMASFTSAMGGWWDAAFVLGVIGAGGCARGYRVVINGDGTRRLERCDPLNPMGYDMVLATNNEDTLDRLNAIIVRNFA